MVMCSDTGLQVVVIAWLLGATGTALDPQQLIKEYGACNARLEVICYELETTEEFAGERRVYSLQYGSDNERKHWIGNWAGYNEDGTVDRERSGLVREIYGEQFGVHLQLYNPESGGTRPPRANLVRDLRDKYLQSYLEHPPYGGVLTGRFSGSNDQSVHDLLAASSNPRGTANVATMLGYDVHLIEADTPYGIVKAWIAPDAGYNCLKWEIHKGPQQYYRDGAFVDDDVSGSIATYDVEAVEEIDDRYVVTEARFNYRVNRDEEVLSDSTYRFVLSNVDLSPDYDAMRAFEIDLPEGTVVSDEGQPNIQYLWTGGRLVAGPAPSTRRVVATEPDRPKVAEPQDLSPVSKSNIVRHIEHLASLESRYVTHPGNRGAEEYIVSELERYGYSPATDAFEAQGMRLHNVTSGSSDKTRPAILVSAHFDSIAHIDGALSPQAPGADDNASGVAAVLELARILRERARTENLEFVFFNAEETGKSGSNHLSDKYKLNQWPIEYLITIDTIGTWTGLLSEACPVNYVTDTQSADVVQHLQEHFPYWLRKSPTMWRDDHAGFWRNGFKAIEITEDGLTPHMHKPTDTAEKLQYDNIAKIVYGLYVVLNQ